MNCSNIPEASPQSPNSPAPDTRARHFELRGLVTIPNVLSVSRLLLLPAILLLLQARQTGPALTLMLLSWLSDALDGYLARRLHQVTNLGKILDHVVDKIWVGAILVMLVATRGLPVLIAAIVIARDLIIVAGSLLILDLRHRVTSSNTIGKAAGLVFAILMMLYCIDEGYPWLQLPKRIALIALYGVVIASLVSYARLYVQTMREHTG